MQKIISFIIPVYNGELTIKHCLDSILRAKTNLPYEIIVINDGSTDQTANILLSYGDEANIKILTQPNQGVSAARNLGIRHAKSKWLCFVDADDSLSSDWSTKIEAATSQNANLIIFTKKGELKNYQQQELAEQICIPHGEQALKTCWSKLYSRSIIVREQISFDTTIINGEDMIFNLEFIAHSKSAVLIPESFYIYHYSSTSATHQFSYKYIESDKRFHQVLARIIKKHYPNKAYLSQISKINAWYVTFMRYGKMNTFNYADLQPFIENQDYREALQNYKKYKKFFSTKERILLSLLRHGKYKTAFYLINTKKRFLPTKASSEEI